MDVRFKDGIDDTPYTSFFPASWIQQKRKRLKRQLVVPPTFTRLIT